MARSAWVTVTLLAIAAPIASAVPAAQTAFDRVRTTDDVGWLERLASTPGIAEREAPRGYHPKMLRQAAYIRLGAIGTREATSAIHRIEDAARREPLVPRSFQLGAYVHPAGHFSDWSLQLAARLTADDGQTYGVLAADFLGGTDLFLTRTRTPDDPASWSRPLLVPDARVPLELKDATLRVAGAGVLILEYAVPTAGRRGQGDAPAAAPTADARSVRISAAEVARDQDGDGWTDAEEKRFGTNPTARDSDGDGVTDDLDVSPLYAAPATEAADEEAAILRRAIFAGYGITGAHSVFVVKSSSRPLQLWGLTSPVLFGVDRDAWFAAHGSAPPLLNWTLASLLGADAVVNIGDYEAPLAAAGYTARLKKIGGEWFVVSYTMNWIS